MTNSYKTTVRWLGGHKGFLTCGNGPAMAFAAPPDAHGEYGVLTPEDAFVAAVNTCIHMMFIWACERFKVDLVSYECEAEAIKQVRLDKTEEFIQVTLRPCITARGADERRVQRAITSARKYSLIAESIRCPVTIEPQITMVE